MRNSGVYLIRCTVTGLYKIGVSVDVQKRLTELQTGSAPELELVLVLPGNEKREQELHKRFAVKHVRGEWYSLHPEDVIALALVPLNDAVPRVVGRLAAPAGDQDVWTVSIECPHCGTTHVHGAGRHGTDLGDRVAHCSNGSNVLRYFIEASTSF